MGGFCAAVDCSNDRNELASAKKKSEKEKISFCKLPKDQKVAEKNCVDRSHKSYELARMYIYMRSVLLLISFKEHHILFIITYMKGNFTL